MGRIHNRPTIAKPCYCIGLGWVGLCWAGLDWVGLDWFGLDWIGWDWTGFGCVGLGEVGLGKVRWGWGLLDDNYKYPSVGISSEMCIPFSFLGIVVLAILVCGFDSPCDIFYRCS